MKLQVPSGKGFLRSLVALAVLGMAVHLAVAADEVENVPEAEGFWGLVTGKVVSVREDGRNFVLAISKAEVDAANSSLKESAPLLGKELTLGVRTPKGPDGMPGLNAEDIAYVKTLKPGVEITVKIFAPRAHPRVHRIQGPPADAKPATTPAPGSKFTVAFPDLPPTFYRLDTEEKIPAQMTIFLPHNYDPSRKQPLLIYLDGGNGGRATDPRVARALSEERDFVCVILPLFKEKCFRSNPRVMARTSRGS